MGKVESFELDHTKVKAPYVRLITVEEGKKGDKISNFDLRLVQPNENAIPTGGLHIIEHLLAGFLLDRIEATLIVHHLVAERAFIFWFGVPHQLQMLLRLLRKHLKKFAIIFNGRMFLALLLNLVGIIATILYFLLNNGQEIF